MCGPFLSADGGLRHVVFCSVEWLQMTNMATMYALKPIYDDKIDLQLPNCMYKMDNVNKSRQTQMEAPVSDDDDNPLSALERRQDRILQQLEKLKSEVNNLLEKSENQKSMDVKQETPCTAVKMVINR
uniref:Aminoacyl tRNA synthase complex-interacting multifunctional protein 2-like n=1 Tax=Saccoglossus kowalevskii TaxID=10224 RepID=A0ABM0MW97_SACKO